MFSFLKRKNPYANEIAKLHAKADTTHNANRLERIHAEIDRLTAKGLKEIKK